MIELQEALGRTIEFCGSVYDILYPKTGSNANAPWSLIRVALSIDYQKYELYDGVINHRAPAGIGGFVAIGGRIPPVAPSNNMYRFTAVLENSPKYGPTYRFISMAIEEDATAQNKEIKILSHVLTQHKLKLLLDSGLDPIQMLRTGDEAGLASIKGIGPFTAHKMVTDYIEKYSIAKEEASFYDLGLTKKMIEIIIAKYHSPDRAKAVIASNPYQLIEDVRGIGWARADAIAQRAGLGPHSKERLKAYTLYYLNNLANTEGHTWVTIQDLGAKVKEIVPDIEDKILIECFEDLIGCRKLFYDQDSMRVSMGLYRSLEEHIADELTRLNSFSVGALSHIDEAFEEAEKETGYIYTEEQKAAVMMCINNPVSLITGTAGTGKSSIMLPFTKILHKNGKEFRQVALSGKAALNLSEITGETGMTIHRLLGIYKEDTGTVDEDIEDISEADLKQQEPFLPYDAIILDELSMVGGGIFYKLIRCLRPGTRLIMLGDPGQLESIGLCNLIKDIQDSGVIPNVCLTKIHRQAALSGIVTEATKVYNQEHIVPVNFAGELVAGEKRDFKLVTAETVEEVATKAIEWYDNFMRYLNAKPDEICVVVAKRAAGMASARAINEEVQKKLVFHDRVPLIFQYSDSGVNYSVTYHEGDRVLVTKNNYNTYNCVTGEKCPIFNGNVGTIKEIDAYNEGAKIEFPQGTVYVDKENFAYIQLGYAITCHKMQGSGINYVIYVCDPSAYTLLSKEHLYTGITRAKKLCVVLGRASTIRFATSTTRVKKKQTWLAELLKERN